jgi:hypothetical protein
MSKTNNETYKKFQPLGEINSEYPTNIKGNHIPLDLVKVVMNWSTLNCTFNCLQGEILTIIDALGMSKEQSKALKDIIKNGIWSNYRDMYAAIVTDEELVKIGFQSQGSLENQLISTEKED